MYVIALLRHLQTNDDRPKYILPFSEPFLIFSQLVSKWVLVDVFSYFPSSSQGSSFIIYYFTLVR